MDVSEQLDRLYDLPLEEFTAARDEVARDLRERGEREAAAEVKALRRPTVAAWTVNQLVRRHPGEVQELLSLREELRGAQRTALSGRGGGGLREIGERRRAVIDALLGRVEAVLTQGGHATTRSTLDRVQETLLATTLDEDAARAVAEGRLPRELSSPTGLESLTGEAPAGSAPTRDRKDRERARRAAEEAGAAEEAAGRADQEARRLEREAERSQKEAERARREAERATARAAELRRRAEELERGLPD